MPADALARDTVRRTTLGDCEALAARAKAGQRLTPAERDTVIRGVPSQCHCGLPMAERGRGAYPYACGASDKWPDAMVYAGCPAGHTCWSYDAMTATHGGDTHAR